MARRLRLGRIWAVPIHGTATLPVLVLFVAAGAGWQVGAAVPGYPVAAYAAAGLFSSCLFLWTVFAHETAHVAAARRYRAKVKGVTLSALGGLTEIAGEPASPWQGVVVAIAGPIVSAACALGCLGAAFGLAALGVSPLVAISVGWVGLMSGVLAVLNLVPAAPLDGGHVLQAVLWAGLGNRRRATAISARAGQVLAVSMAVFAVWSLVRGSSLLLVAAIVLVIWPVWRGASAVWRSGDQRAALGGRTVAEATRPSQPLPADLALADAAARLPGGAGHVVVVDGRGRPVGVLSASRLRKAAGRDPARPVASLLRTRGRVRTAGPGEGLADVLERNNARLVAVAVVEDDRLVGLLEPEAVRAMMRAGAAQPFAEPVADVWPGLPR
jgi:Zn-dependent protease/CBS domain-containing protein